MSDIPDPDDGPAFPLGVRIAGWIWVGLGWLIAGGSLVLVFVISILVHPCPAFVFVLAILLGIGLREVGSAIDRGDAKDVLVPAVLSLIVAVPELLVVGLAVILGVQEPSVLIEAAGPVGLFAAQGFLLAAAGVLALSDREKYLDWREANRPESGTGADADSPDHQPPSGESRHPS